MSIPHIVETQGDIFQPGLKLIFEYYASVVNIRYFRHQGSKTLVENKDSTLNTDTVK